MITAFEARNQFTQKQWLSLPLTLRCRWWKETDYGLTPPSAELMRDITTQMKD
jgi:hypothetical protein